MGDIGKRKTMMKIIAGFVVIALAIGVVWAEGCTYTVTTTPFNEDSDNNINAVITPVMTPESVEEWYNKQPDGETAIEELKETGKAKVVVHQDSRTGKASIVVVQTPIKGKQAIFAMKSTFLEEKFKVKLVDGDDAEYQDEETIRIGGDAVTGYRVLWRTAKDAGEGIAIETRNPDFCVRTSVQFAAQVETVEFLDGNLTPVHLFLSLTERRLFFDICANCNCVRAHPGGPTNESWMDGLTIDDYDPRIEEVYEGL